MWKLSAADKAQIVVQYQAGASSVALAEQFGIHPTNIRGLLKRRGITRRTQNEAQKRCALREDAFDAPDPDALYWAGFIAADGSLGIRKTGAPFLAVVLAERDREHLVALREFLGSTHALTPVARKLGEQGGPAVRYSVRSSRLHATLTDLGVKGPRVAAELLGSRDFWRGVVDGDGWVGGDARRPRLQLVGYEYLVEPFAAFLARECGTGATCRPHKSIYCVQVNGEPARRAIRSLYGSCSASLARKRATAETLLAA